MGFWKKIKCHFILNKYENLFADLREANHGRPILNYTEQRNMQKALKKAGGLKFRTILIPKA